MHFHKKSGLVGCGLIHQTQLAETIAIFESSYLLTYIQVHRMLFYAANLSLNNYVQKFARIALPKDCALWTIELETAILKYLLALAGPKPHKIS